MFRYLHKGNKSETRSLMCKAKLRSLIVNLHLYTAQLIDNQNKQMVNRKGIYILVTVKISHTYIGTYLRTFELTLLENICNRDKF